MVVHTPIRQRARNPFFRDLRPGIRTLIRSLSAILLSMQLFLGAVYAHASEYTAEDWLSRMMMAARDQSYRGDFVYSNGLTLESMRIVHTIQEHDELQRIYTLNGTPREIVRHGDRLEVRQADGQSSHFIQPSHAAPFPMLSAREINDLEPHYDLKLLDSSRVAERICQGVALIPRDSLRYGHRLWLDEETGLLLRAQLLGTSGEVLEELLFTEIHMEEGDTAWSPADQQQTAPAKTQARVDVPENQQTWRLDSPPPGFKRVAYLRHRASDSDAPAENLVFSDGVATVSVYIGPEIGAHGKVEGLSRMGATHTYGFRTAQGQHVMVVGEVPAETAEWIANAVGPTERVSD